ncbi:CGNR zinc finger domain-containing protein [Nocardioides pacificus]
MDFIAYAEGSASLLNAELADVGALTAHLADREWLLERVTDKDPVTLRRFQRELRPVFEASGAGDTHTVVEGINTLLERYPLTPRISDHDSRLHLHVAHRNAGVAELLISESLLGLATLVCDLGPSRLGVCSASPCTQVYVDTSPNRSRRYCSDRCSSRANVAAYRARQKALSPDVAGARG